MIDAISLRIISQENEDKIERRWQDFLEELEQDLKHTASVGQYTIQYIVDLDLIDKAKKYLEEKEYQVRKVSTENFSGLFISW